MVEIAAVTFIGVILPSYIYFIVSSMVGECCCVRHNIVERARSFNRNIENAI